jgi:hypothetical protein
MTPAYRLNQFSPDAFQGTPQPPPQQLGYEDRPFDYVYNPPTGALSASQILSGQTVQIQTDSDFELRAWYIATATGLFQIRLGDATGYQFSSGYILSGAISTDPSNPTVFSPQHPFPAGSRIMIDIQDLSAAPNTIQIIFKGVKRFRMGQPAQS